MSQLKICKRIFKLAHEKLRHDYIENKKKLIKTAKKKRVEIPQEIECNEKWPICQVQIEKLRMNEETEFFIFKQGPILDILKHEDYFGVLPDNFSDINLNLNKKRSIPFISMIDNLVIGRYTHICKEKREDQEGILKKIPESRKNNLLEISQNETEISIQNNPILFDEIKKSQTSLHEKLEAEITRQNELKLLKRRKAEVFKTSKKKRPSRKKAQSWHLFYTPNQIEEVSLSEEIRCESACLLMEDTKISKKFEKSLVNFDLFPRLNKERDVEKIGRVACSPSFIFIKSLNIGKDEQFFINSFKK
jgi:hypothetical protein